MYALLQSFRQTIDDSTAPLNDAMREHVTAPPPPCSNLGWDVMGEGWLFPACLGPAHLRATYAISCENRGCAHDCLFLRSPHRTDNYWRVYLGSPCISHDCCELVSSLGNNNNNHARDMAKFAFLLISGRSLLRDHVFTVNHHATLRPDRSAFTTASRSLARTLLFRHLLKLDIDVHVFEHLSDPLWLEYEARKKVMRLFSYITVYRLNNVSAYVRNGQRWRRSRRRKPCRCALHLNSEDIPFPSSVSGHCGDNARRC